MLGGATPCAGLAQAAPALADVAQQPLVHALHDLLLPQLSGTTQHAQQGGAQPPYAACGLLASLTAQGFRRGWLSSGQASDALALLLGMLGGATSAGAGAGPALDGWAVGSAAATLGSLLPALLAQGYSPEAGCTAEAVLQVRRGKYQELEESGLLRVQKADGWQASFANVMT